jgi:pimeloyl-ACP methyl ester carboxylesterase
LDAHSSLAVLRGIEHDCLIMTGLLDHLTPCYLSYEMHSALRNSRLRVFNLASHFLPAEFAQDVADEIADFCAKGNNPPSPLPPARPAAIVA